MYKIYNKTIAYRKMGKSVQIRFSSVGILLLFLAINLILYAEHGVYASIIHILKAEGFLDW